MKNRNKYCYCLMDQLLENKIQEPFDKFPPDGPLPRIMPYQFVRLLISDFYLTFPEHEGLQVQKAAAQVDPPQTKGVQDSNSHSLRPLEECLYN